MSKSYAEKLKDVRWQQKRLYLLEKANWTCQRSGRGCKNPNPMANLQIHHWLYLRKHQLWDYEDWAYAVYCDQCHALAQDAMEASHAMLAKNRHLILVLTSLATLDSDEVGQFLQGMDLFGFHRQDRMSARISAFIQMGSVVSELLDGFRVPTQEEIEADYQAVEAENKKKEADAK